MSAAACRLTVHRWSSLPSLLTRFSGPAQPTRASLMTGRYPWGVGYYDMKGPEMVPLSFVMLPQLLHDMGFATHALGKWNLGNLVKVRFLI